MFTNITNGFNNANEFVENVSNRGSELQKKLITSAHLNEAEKNFTDIVNVKENITNQANQAKKNFTRAADDTGNIFNNTLSNISNNVPGLSEKINTVTGNLTEKLSSKAGEFSEKIPGLNFLSSAMKTSEKIKNIKNPLKSNIDKDCAKNAYGQLILTKDNEELIKEKVEQFINRIFDEKDPIIEKKDIINETKKLFFNQLRRSIWEDYHIKHMLVYTMISNINDFSMIGPIFQNSLENMKNDNSSSTQNINTIFTNFMNELHKYITYDENNSYDGKAPNNLPPSGSYGGKKQKKKGGAIVTPDNIQIAEKISSWYNPNSDEEIINDKILYIIKNSIKDALNEPDARVKIYKGLTTLFENQIGILFQSLDGSELKLKFFILYKLLSEDTILEKSFKTAIGNLLTYANENGKSYLNIDEIQNQLMQSLKRSLYLKEIENKYKPLPETQPIIKTNYYDYGAYGGKRRKSKSKKRISKKRTSKKRTTKKKSQNSIN